ncbi:MAG: CoA pyrophosphatase [Lautropia sp.]|nr:CoA pyrophosphatase [Lautropia sp.]
MSNTIPRFDPVAAPILPATPEKPLPASRLNIDWLRQRFSCPPVWQPEPEPVIVRGGVLDDAQLVAWLDAQGMGSALPPAPAAAPMAAGGVRSGIRAVKGGLADLSREGGDVPSESADFSREGGSLPPASAAVSMNGVQKNGRLLQGNAGTPHDKLGRAAGPAGGSGGKAPDILRRSADVPAAVLIALLPKMPGVEELHSLNAAIRQQGGLAEDIPRQDEALTLQNAAFSGPDEEGPGVLLTVRSHRLRKHRGQIAFPGGRVDASDASVEAAALREAHEEIGLANSAVQLLGRLPQHPTGTGFRVHPVVGVVDAAHGVRGLSPAPDEVDEVFVVPLSFLMNPANHRRHLARWQEDGEHYCMRFYSMPWQSPDGHEYFIWGATATMLRNLYRFLIAD